MSGGSYEYLCLKDADECMSYSFDSNLEAMVHRLAGLGYAKDAALESERLLARVRALRVQTEVAIERLSGVWKAVEWWDSNDWSEKEVKEELEKYRGA